MNFIKKHNIYESKTPKKLCSWTIYNDIIILKHQKDILEIQKGELTQFQKDNNYNIHLNKVEVNKNKYKSKDELITILSKRHKKYKEDSNQIKHILDISRFNNINKAIVYFAYKKGLKEYFSQSEPLTEIESEFIQKASKAGLIQCKTGAYQNVVNYDINSMYPYIMNIQYFKIPIKQGELKVFEELPEIVPYGIYRVKITRPTKAHKSFFAFKKKINNYYYTSIDIVTAKQQGLNIELIQDEKPNALIYDNDSRINAHRLFKKFVDKFYNMKQSEEYKKNKLIKRILNTLWGELCRKDFVYNDKNNDIYEEGIEDGEKLKVTNTNFTYNFARMKPFITAYGRQIMHKLLQDIPYDKVYRIHTDSILCDDSVKLPISDKIGALKIEYKSPLVIIHSNTEIIKA